MTKIENKGRQNRRVALTLVDPLMEPLVSVAWLAERLGSADLIVFDATKFLPNEGRDGKAEFATAHIPGARFFDIDVVADPETTLPHMAPSAGRFERLMGDMGVGNDSMLVFYDQKGHRLVGARLVVDGADSVTTGSPCWMAACQLGGAPVTRSRPARLSRLLPHSIGPAFGAERLRGLGVHAARRSGAGRDRCAPGRSVRWHGARAPARVAERPYAGAAPACPRPSCWRRMARCFPGPPCEAGLPPPVWTGLARS